MAANRFSEKITEDLEAFGNFDPGPVEAAVS
jgi:hypothetical protein